MVGGGLKICAEQRERDNELIVGRGERVPETSRLALGGRVRAGFCLSCLAPASHSRSSTSGAAFSSGILYPFCSPEDIRPDIIKEMGSHKFTGTSF